MGAHGSPAAGYKILYTNWRFRFIWCLHGCYILGSKLILQFPFYLIRVHVSDIEMEVAFLCPMSGLLQRRQVSGVALVFRAASMSIGTGLPGDGLEWVKRAAGTAGSGQDIARGQFAVGAGT